MAYQIEDNLSAALLPLLRGGSDNPLAQALGVLLNAAMQIEREKHIGAAPYERSAERNGQANGYKERTLSTRLGQIAVSVPQVRGGSEPFRPQSLEAALLSEKALKVALAEMYVQGVSTRKVSAVLESLCGTTVSSASVSRTAKELDEVLVAWRERSLSVFPFVQLDALWCKVSYNFVVRWQNGLVKDAAVLVASGVGEKGKRSLLGVSVSSGEHEVHWRGFLESLVERGLRGVQLITSDDHGGLKAARRAVLGGLLWQRCQFHLQQNAQAYVPKESMKAEVAAWMEEAVPEGLTVFGLPEPQRRFLRTSNGLERVNKELRRRFRVVGSFVSVDSCLRLASAVLMEISDEWEMGEIYLTLAQTE